jgi:hypothetical protein
VLHCGGPVVSSHEWGSNLHTRGAVPPDLLYSSHSE